MADDARLPLVLLLPGEEGDSRSPHVQAQAAALRREGFRVGVVDRADAPQTVKAVVSQYPRARVYLVGFSGGGPTTLKLAADPQLSPRVGGLAVIGTLFAQISSQKLREVTAPTLVLHSKNDNMAPFSTVPLAELRELPNYLLVFTPAGAHLEFFVGRQRRRWHAEPVSRFLAALDRRPPTNEK